MSRFFSKTVTQNLINILVFGICIGVLFLGFISITAINVVDSSLPKIIEHTWRSQAKASLNDLRNRLARDITKGTVKVEDELSLQEWSKQNLSGATNGGPTGDGFMINLGNEKFLWDGSPDCAKPEFVTNGRFMKDESQLHMNKEQAVKILELMRLGLDTEPENNYWWQFDDSKEYLEWVVVPTDKIGFNNEPYTVGGIKNPKYTKILIQLGTQKDEIEKPYEPIFDALKNIKKYVYVSMIVSFIICIINMMIYVFLSKFTTVKTVRVNLK